MRSSSTIEGIDDTALNRLTKGQSACSMTIAAGYELGKGGWAIDIAFNQASGGEIDLGVAGLELSRSTRILRLIFDPASGWKPTDID